MTDLVEVSVELTVLDPPAVPELYFWALQASFRGEAGRRYGAGHAGLQHHPGHPGATAVNWGGYDVSGRELTGSESALPSALGNANTRDMTWSVGRPHRVTIGPGERGWVASVDDVTVRELYAGGDRLDEVVMWSEVFAACDAPSVAVRWSNPRGRTRVGDAVAPAAVELRYQSTAAGGCSNTSSESTSDGAVVQRTGVERAHRAGTVLRLRP